MLAVKSRRMNKISSYNPYSINNKNNKAAIIVALFVLVIIGLTGCNNKKNVAPATYSWDEADIYEAEKGIKQGGTCISTELPGFSGDGYVDHFENEGDGLELKIEIPENGFYDLNFISASIGADYKENYLYIDGEEIGTVSVQSGDFSDSLYERVYLTSGEHSVSVTKYWGWIAMDCLKVKKSNELDPSIYEVNRELCNEKPSPNTTRLYNYMCDMYGEKIISGQYCSSMYGPENVAIQRATGYFPAVMGLDYGLYSTSPALFGEESDATTNALDYWNQGGIVTISWYWYAPIKYHTGEWDQSYLTDYTNINLTKIFDESDEEGLDLLKKDIDAIAEQLLILKEADVPVLWRPLPEASSGWYWWGNGTSDEYIQLYQYMYDRLTNYHGLNNLIWIWNGQDSSWYPGDEYVDIISWDVYSGEHIYIANTQTFLEATQCSEKNKMVVLSENGCLFDPELAFRDGSTWGFFCTGKGEYVIKEGTVNEYSGRFTEESVLKRAYGDFRIITRDDLPDIKTYGDK